MTLPLTREMLERAWDYFRETPPFKRMKLPPSGDVRFIVGRDKKIAGYHKMANGKHIVGVSSGCIGRTHSLMEVMAHEMIHAHQRETSLHREGVEHNAGFLKIAERVCRIHGFDPKLF